MLHQESFLEKSAKWFFIGLLGIILVYFSTRIFNFITGPRIKIYSPLPGQIIKDPTFFIEGNIKNAKSININGKEISIDEEGNFKEEMIAKAPYTLIVIDAIDKYGKIKEVTLDVGKE